MKKVQKADVARIAVAICLLPITITLGSIYIIKSLLDGSLKLSTLFPKKK